MIMQNRTVWHAALALGLMACAASSVGAPSPPATIVVGTQTLVYCNSDLNGYCGSIERPFDPVNRSGGTITIGFEYYPRTDQAHASRGTFLPQEGGPGYSSTGTRDAYVGLLATLRAHRDILIVDKRGTGLSEPIDCPDLQAATSPASLAACAKQLGKTAWYYGSANAAADVVAVLDALAIDRVDYYGDSYGTYFGQTMAARFPSRLRSIVLDSAYPVRPPDAWFPTDWATARDGYDLVCERSVSCRKLGHKSTQLLTRLLNLVRKTPISGTAPDADGVAQRVTLDVPTLFIVMFNAGNSPPIYRDLDAAARAWFEHGDRRPLLRLAAEVTAGGSASDPIDFSAGLYTAVICQEYPLLYRFATSPAQRRDEYKVNLAQARVSRADIFAPFTFDEAVASGLDITPLDTCLDWPAPPAGYAQGDALPAHPVFPPVPTLVLTGDIDSITSPTDATQAASQFPDVVHLFIPNLTHITAFSNEGGNVSTAGVDYTLCVSKVVLNFIQNLVPGDTSCLPKVRPIRTVPKFARTVADVDSAIADTGNAGGTTELRLAAAATETVGDAIARFFINFGGGDAGLRGGSFTYQPTASGQSFTLTKLKWTRDLEVSGTISWNLLTSAIHAKVILQQHAMPIGHLKISWTDTQTAANAFISGTINGKAIKAHRIAP
jgi:pimeloyl-ACP methyl ester carboxylesterase